MIADNLRCSVAGCDDLPVTQRGNSLGEKCARHRDHPAPVQHAPRVCPGCASEFTPRRSDQVHCSKRCRNRLSARRTYQPRSHLPPRRRPLSCEVCGVTYLGVWGRFCSGRCTNKAWKERRRDDYLAGKRRYHQHANARVQS